MYAITKSIIAITFYFVAVKEALDPSYTPVAVPNVVVGNNVTLVVAGNVCIL